MSDSKVAEQAPDDSASAQLAFSDRPVSASDQKTVIHQNRQQSSVVKTDSSGSSLIGPPSGIWKRLFTSAEEYDSAENFQGPAGVELGHFTIEERIGTGGMGAVYRATDKTLQRDIALKVLAPAATHDENAVQRFLNEARAAARLDHENIARVFYQGFDQGLHFIAFEYVTGQNIRDIIRSTGRLDPAVALNYTLQIAIALKHTSEAGVIHRDIKPSNIIITPNGRAKLVDLGLARKENSESVGELTSAGTTLGTFDYISPEQAKDPRAADVRSDIYSLGCTLYHMLTGEPPYPEGTVLQKLLDHQGKETPDPRRINPYVPHALADITKRMMASNPKERPASPVELIQELTYFAREMGLRGVHPEGLVWQSAVDPPAGRENFLQKHLGWLVAVAVLLFVVFWIGDLPRSSEFLATVEPVHQPVEPGVPVSPNKNPAVSTNTKTPGAATQKTPPVQPEAVTGTENKSNPKTEPNTNTDSTSSSKTATPVANVQNKMTPQEPVVPTVSQPETNNTQPTPPPVAMKKPAISVVDGKDYKTLEAACLEAKDGAIIELAFDGKWPGRSEKMIKIANKKITIRAARNAEGELYQPQIEFALEDNAAVDDVRIFSLLGSSLDLINVQLSVIVNDKIEAEQWAVFSLQEADQLRLQGVRLVVQNPSHQTVSVVALSPQPGGTLDRMDKTKTGSSLPPPEFGIKISKSQLQGDCDFVSHGHIFPGRIELENSLIAIDGTLLNLKGSLDMPSEGASLNLQFEHVTCIVGNSLIRYHSEELWRELLPVHVTARNNIMATNTSRPLIAMSGNTNPNDLKRLLRWNGEKNYYDQFQSFWTLSSKKEFMELESHNFESWQQIWTASQEGNEDSAMNRGLLWKGNWIDMEFSDIVPESVELQPNAEFQANDGSNIGVDFTSLPKPTPAPTAAETDEAEELLPEPASD